MEIIVSHNNVDFDGLASMVAAHLLHPRAEMVFIGNLSGNVKQFMALHKDSLSIHRAKEIPQEQVKRIIMVDTHNPRRLGSLSSLVYEEEMEIYIYDHHPEKEADLEATFSVIEPLGATTTILVEMIQAQGIPISAFEATILALGIYEDTGSLIFPNTTARDVWAVAYLLDQGANLGVVASFIERPLSEDQKMLYNQLLHNAYHKYYHGVNVLLITGSVDEYIADLSFLTHKIGEIETYDVVFTVVKMDKRVYLVARSRLESVSVNEICAVFGGGGHDKAASAVIKEGSLEQVIVQLNRVLEEKIRPPLLAYNIMSSPVKTVPMELSIDEAGKIMLRYGHTGLPVVDGDQVVGVISRRDIDKAKLHDLGHAPVKAYMARKVVSITPETPVTEIQLLMIENDIGRLPVIESGRLVGIVSRTDVLRTLHGKNYPEDHQTLYISGTETNKPANVCSLMEQHLNQSLLTLLVRIGKLADEHGSQVYLVGGFVRDLLLRVDNLDVDLVVEGDGPAFARYLAKALGGQVTVHQRFSTATVITGQKFRLDIASARVEYYEYPAALPKVENASLRHDLYRRDFTINAMAIQLNQKYFGNLIDFFGGQRDLEQELIRVLYNLSFVEDPTRIIRAIRFEQRYGFTIEPQTLSLALDAMDHNFLRELSFQRIRDELILILNEGKPLPALYRLVELKVFRHILPEVEFNQDLWAVLSRVSAAIERFKELFPSVSVENWIVYFLLLVQTVGLEQATTIVNRFHLERRVVEALNQAIQAERKLACFQVTSIAMSALDKVLDGLWPEALIYLMVKTKSTAWRETLERYLSVSQGKKLTIDGYDLIKMGLKPGPEFSRILAAVRDARLDGLVNSRDEELTMAYQLLQAPKEV